MSDNMRLETSDWQEYKKEVDGVEKVFVEINGVEYEVVPKAQLDENGEPVLDEDGNPVLIQNFNNEDNVFVDGVDQNVNNDPINPMDE